jgi:quercetin dioxygenase-like cupin family protein
MEVEITGNFPKLKHSVSANTWIRQMHFEKAGDSTCGHSHTFDHQTLFTNGTFIIRAGVKHYEVTAPTIFITKAGIEHEIIAKEDGCTAFCIHALRKGENIEDIASPEEITEGWHENDTNPLVVEGRGEIFYKQAPKVAEPVNAD